MAPLEIQLDLPNREICESGLNLLAASFAAESRVMTCDAIGFKLHSGFRNHGIAAYPKEWHHIIPEAEIFAWSSENYAFPQGFQEIRRMIVWDSTGSGMVA